MFSRIVVVTSDVFVRRLSPALAAFVKEKRDFRIVDIRHPMAELQEIIRSCQPSAVVTEFIPKVTQSIVELGYPTVIADTDEIFERAVSIDVDDCEVGKVAGKFLLECGYRSIACVHSSTPYSLQRLAGFQAVASQMGLVPARFRYPARPDRNYMESWRDHDRGLLDWLEQLKKPAGIFAVHDPLGRSVCEAVMEAGLRVPDDIAVVGANNDELVCELTYPPLSSVSIPWDRIGSLAGEWVQKLIDGEQAPRTPMLVNPGPVVSRQSTAISAVNDLDLRRVIQFFRDNAASDINVQSTCDALRLSRRSVERKFRQILLSSPWEALCRQRTEIAKRLLAETDLPMALISERAGFGSPERFSIVFRRLNSKSPSEYRKLTRGAERY